MTVASVAAGFVSVAVLLVLAMIGQTIHARPAFPLGVLLWLLAALATDGVAVVSGNSHWAVFSLLPWLAALLLWRGRVRPLTLHFTEAALEVEEPPLQVPYATFQGLLAPRRPANPFKAGPPSYLIQLIHSQGVLLIPAQLNVPSDQVFSFLYRQFSPSGARDVPPALTDFLRRKERAFGSGKVWTYRARTHLGRIKSYPRLRAFFLALLLAAAAWLLWGIFQQQEGWIGGGGFALFFGGLFSFLLWLDGRRNFAGVRKWRQAGVVIAPDGLALAQGDMIGELRWDEVRDVKAGNTTATFQFTTTNQPLRGIIIKVEGAIIVIADIYDRPLGLIHQNICYYWRGQTLDDRDRQAMPALSTERIRSAGPGAPRPSSAEGITPPE